MFEINKITIFEEFLIECALLLNVGHFFQRFTVLFHTLQFCLDFFPSEHLIFHSLHYK